MKMFQMAYLKDKELDELMKPAEPEQKGEEASEDYMNNDFFLQQQKIYEMIMLQQQNEAADRREAQKQQV